MQISLISWTGQTWNFLTGCSKVSDGCKHCYAMVLSLKRGWTKLPWTVQNEAENVLLKPHKLHEPYLLKEPTRIFVNSMSDLHHRAVPDWFRAAGWCVMLDLPQHVFQVLTKRSESLADWDARFLAALASPEFAEFRDQVKDKRVKAALSKPWTTAWADNIWQGVSVEDSRVLKRLDDLRACGAKVKFVSAEPLLGAWGADANVSGLDWIIVGGESGFHLKDEPHRVMQQAWAREIKRLCLDNGVAFFYKQDSGHKTELRPWLVEEDGSKWRWHQYPGDLTPPVPLDEHGEPIIAAYADVVTDEMNAMECYRRAAYWRTYGVQPVMSAVQRENADLNARYWQQAGAAKARQPTDPPTPPPNPPLNDRDFIDPPTVNHPDQYDEDDCDAAAYGEDEGELRAQHDAPSPLANVNAGDRLQCAPLTTGDDWKDCTFVAWSDEYPDRVKIDHPDLGVITLAASGVRVPLEPSPAPPLPEALPTPLTIGADVLHVGTQDRGILRRIDPAANRAYVQAYGADGLVNVPDPITGEPLLVEWLLNFVRDAGASWWIDEGGVIFRADHPTPDVITTCKGPFASYAAADAARSPTWVQASTPEAADRKLHERQQQMLQQYAEEQERRVQEAEKEEARKLAAVNADHERRIAHEQSAVVDKNPVTIADAAPVAEGDNDADTTLDNIWDKALDDLVESPFGDGEWVVVQHNTGGYHLHDFTEYVTLAAGTRLRYVRAIKHDLATFAVVLPGDRVAEQTPFAVSLAVLGAAPVVGTILRFAERFSDGEIVITEYRCDALPDDKVTGRWSWREGAADPWTALGNDDLRRQLDRGLHPNPDHAAPLPVVCTLYTAQMSVSDPDMIDITVKSASTPEGRALAPLWNMVTGHKDGSITDASYRNSYFGMIRARYAKDPAPFLSILQRERVVLKCYCAAEPGTFCHRHLAAELLTEFGAQHGIRVVAGGEVLYEKRDNGQTHTPAPVEDAAPVPALSAPPQPRQLSMFDLLPA